MEEITFKPIGYKICQVINKADLSLCCK